MMNLQQALELLNISIESDGQTTSYVMEIEETSKILTVTDIDLAISKHRQELASIAESFLIGGLQYYHKRQIQALSLIREIVLRSGDKVTPSIDSKHAPSLFDSVEYRQLVETMQLHKLYKSTSVDFTFAHKVMCRTCGEMSIDTDEDLHIAHQILLAGFRK